MTPRLIQVGTNKHKIHVALTRRGWSILDKHGKVTVTLVSLIACIVRCRNMGYDTRYQQVVS